jgi:hypothetical protein
MLAILPSALKEPKTFAVFLYIAMDTFIENHHITNYIRNEKCNQLYRVQKSFSEKNFFRLLFFNGFQNRCIPMYSVCIQKWLNTVYEYTEYIIFQVQMKILFPEEHFFIKLRSCIVYQK